MSDVVRSSLTAVTLALFGVVFDALQEPATARGIAQLHVLHSFTGGKNDGAQPMAALVADGAGALYGTTATGGPRNAGTVFAVTPSGSAYAESVLYALRGGRRDGAYPMAPLLLDAQGNLYGTTSVGGLSVDKIFTYCGDTLDMDFARSEFRNRQGLLGGKKDVEVSKGQRYAAPTERAQRVCGTKTTASPLPIPSDALPFALPAGHGGGLS